MVDPTRGFSWSSPSGPGGQRSAGNWVRRKAGRRHHAARFYGSDAAHFYRMADMEGTVWGPGRTLQRHTRRAGPPWPRAALRASRSSPREECAANRVAQAIKASALETIVRG